MNNIQSLISEPVEPIKCNLCGADDYEVIARKSRFAIPLMTVICRQCGLIYHTPRMTAPGFARFYEYNYRELIGENDTAEQLFGKQKKHGLSILKFIEGYPIKGNCLDIGCGPGGQLAVFKEKGCEVTGIEPAQDHVAWARSTHQLNLIQGLWEEIELKEASFDWIVSTQMLNHLLDPARTMKKIFGLLKPAGLAYIEVMDFVYLTRSTPLEVATTIDHPYMFYPEIFKALLTKNGFEILRFEADSEKKSGAQEKGLPSLHMRALVKKGKKGAAVHGVSYRETLKVIKKNQDYYRRRQLQRRTLDFLSKALIPLAFLKRNLKKYVRK